MVTDQSSQATNFSAWWPGVPRGKQSPKMVARFTPEIRRDFVQTIRWGIRTTPPEIRFRRLRTRNCSAGEKLALEVLAMAIELRPTHQTPSEWLSRCEHWLSAGGDRTDANYPPWPWDRDPSGIAMIWCTLSRTGATVETYREGCDQ